MNQGTIFVNDTNNLTPGSPVTWTLTGATAGSHVGQQFFENDSAVDVVDGNTAIFTGNITVTGNGQINLYGNSEVEFTGGAGVTSGQTINFIADSNGSGMVIEGAGTADAASIAGFQPGDTVVVEVSQRRRQT